MWGGGGSQSCSSDHLRWTSPGGDCFMMFWYKSCDVKWHMKSSSNGVASSIFTHWLFCSWLVLSSLDPILPLTLHYHLLSTSELIKMLIYIEWPVFRCTYLYMHSLAISSGRIDMPGTLYPKESSNLIPFTHGLMEMVIESSPFSVMRVLVTMDVWELWKC